MPEVIVRMTLRSGVTINSEQGSAVTIEGASVNPKDIHRIEKFSRTAQAGYTTLSANQLAGSAEIPTVYKYRTDSLFLLRNGIAMERGAEFSEAEDREGFTLIGTYDTTDKFEARYVKN